MLKLANPSLFRQQAYIDGKWQDAENGATTEVINPANQTRIGYIPEVTAADTRRAIAAAERAWGPWRAMTAQARGVILRRWFELMLKHTDDLAIIMTAEQGKSLAESRGEIAYAAQFLEWYAEEGKRVRGDLLPSPFEDRQIRVAKEPIGVCVAITPWNFPSAMITRKVAPALAAGCTMVVKPAEATPYSALALAVLAEEAGVPAGVFSVVTGVAKEIGGEMTANPSVRKLSFTGSTEVGRLLAKQCAETIKKVSLELGGNAPFIVFDDADLDQAVAGAMASKFRNCGQACVASNRFYVHDTVYDDFAARLVKAVSKLRTGNGTDPDVDLGPLIDKAAVEKFMAHIDDAVSQGARVLAGGKPHALGGQFVEPTVLSEVTQAMKVTHEETFGPLLAMVRFKTEDEVVAQANDTEFGLAAYFYSQSLSRVERVAARLESGMVGINTGLISTAAAPFGGIKQSGLGREGSHYGIDDYLVMKYLCVGGV